MGLQLQVTSKKYYNNIRNNNDFADNLTDFTQNLAHNVLDYSKVEFIVEVGWDSIADTYNQWTITPRDDINTYKFERNVGSFSEDGWSVGNRFAFYNDFSTTNTFLDFGDIDFISDDGLYMFVTCLTDISGVKTDNAIRANAGYSQNYLNSLIFKPNLIQNSESYTDQYLLNGVSIGYSTNNARSVTPVEMQPIGFNKSFVTGSVFVNYEGTTQSFYQVFKITHIFIVNPFYFEGNDITVPPEFFSGSNSLKYVFQTDFRTSLSDLTSSKILVFENNKGTTGFFGETITKNVPVYTFDSCTISNTDNKLSTVGLNTATFRVLGSFDANTRYTLYFSYLATEEEYNEVDTFIDIFKFDFKTSDINTPNTYINGAIKSMDSVIDGSDLVITATFDLAGYDFTVDDSYLIALQVGDKSLSNALSDRTTFIAQTDNFTKLTDNNDLIIFNNINFTNYHGDTASTLTTYNEDGLSISFDFDLDLNKQSLLKKLSAQLVGFNATTGSYFKMDNIYNYDLSSILKIDGVQELNLSANRGYLIDSSSTFNKIELKTAEQTAGFQNYTGLFAQKINWKEWLSNSDADTVFFDNTKINNNLNFKSSNYSNNINNYGIYILFMATCEGEDIYGNVNEQKYTFLSDELTVYDYLIDKDSPDPNIIPTIETFNPDTMTSYAGNISLQTDTLMRVTWVMKVPVTTTLGTTVIHRIEQFNQNGNNIYELSNLDPLIDLNSNPLKPIDGENFIYLYLDNGNLVSECLIDYTKLTNNAYSLSAKITKV